MIVILVGGAAAGAASLIVRYRHGDAVERQQLKLLALAGPLAVVCVVVAGSPATARCRPCSGTSA